MQIANPAVSAVEGRPGAVAKRRRRARLYLAIAERHRKRGDSASLVAALVRAAWNEHREADAACTGTSGFELAWSMPRLGAWTR